MKLFVFSDIHGNSEALEKVIREIAVCSPDFVVSLGDVVGYGADPAACIEMVDEHADIKICGNHDLAAAGVIDCSSFNLNASMSIEWTKKKLAPKHIESLKAYLPLYRQGESLFTHSSPDSPLSWEYIYTIAQAERIFSAFEDGYIFVGHTHIPGVIGFTRGGECAVLTRGTVECDPDVRYLINAGSVGQPRDGFNEAAFTIVDTSRRTISMRRVPYDVRTAQSKILATGLPESLALRLATAK